MEVQYQRRILIATVIVTATIVSASAVYFFGFSLPSQQASLLELKREEQQAQLDLQRKESEAKQDLDKQQREAELAVEKRKQELEEQKYRDTKAAEEKKLNEQRLSELATRLALEECLQNAKDSYDLNWNNSCKTWHDTAVAGYQDCLGRSDKSFCDSLWGGDLRQPEKGCLLPAAKAESVETWKKEAVDQCNRQYPVSGAER